MDPRFDPKEYDNGIQQLKAILPNLVNQPAYKLQTEMYKTLYGDHPRRQMISAETLEKAKTEAVKRGVETSIAGKTGPFIRYLLESYINAKKE
jgi:hypothetical protein